MLHENITKKNVLNNFDIFFKRFGAYSNLFIASEQAV